MAEHYVETATGAWKGAFDPDAATCGVSTTGLTLVTAPPPIHGSQLASNIVDGIVGTWSAYP